MYFCLNYCFLYKHDLLDYCDSVTKYDDAHLHARIQNNFSGGGGRGISKFARGSETFFFVDDFTCTMHI